MSQNLYLVLSFYFMKSRKLRIDNCDFNAISLRFTFLMISRWLYSASKHTIHQIKAEILSYCMVPIILYLAQD